MVDGFETGGGHAPYLAPPIVHKMVGSTGRAKMRGEVTFPFFDPVGAQRERRERERGDETKERRNGRRGCTLPPSGLASMHQGR